MDVITTSPSIPRELQIPEFARNLTKSVSLKMDLTELKRKPMPLHVSSLPVFQDGTDEVSNRATSPPEQSYYIVTKISSRFTESSLRSFLGPESRIGFVRYKILSVNENKGRFEPPLVPQQILTVPGTAIALTRSGVSYMLAYAEKSEFHPLESSRTILELIYQKLMEKYVAIADQPVASSGGPKFGGGLGRKSAGNQPARYIVRSPVGLLSEEMWRQRGASVVDSDNEWTVAKFSRIELRDSSCDSFIVGIELSSRSSSKRFEIGISAINGTMVLIENHENPTDGVPPFRQIETDMFFQ